MSILCTFGKVSWPQNDRCPGDLLDNRSLTINTEQRTRGMTQHTNIPVCAGQDSVKLWVSSDVPSYHTVVTNDKLMEPKILNLVSFDCIFDKNIKCKTLTLKIFSIKRIFYQSFIFTVNVSSRYFEQTNSQHLLSYPWVLTFPSILNACFSAPVLANTRLKLLHVSMTPAQWAEVILNYFQ